MAVIGLWGDFDGDLGLQLFPRVARMELGRRVPSLELRIWTPSQESHSGTEPLGEWSEERLDELAASMQTLVIVDGGDRLGRFAEGLARREAYVPTLRLTEADVVAAAGLARRAFDDEPLEVRIGRLRELGLYPSEEALVIEGAVDRDRVEQVCRTEGYQTAALDHEELEDRVAAIAWSGAFVGASPTARAVARSFGRRVLFADDEPEGDMSAGGDELFDRIAAIALKDETPVTAPPEDGLTKALALRLAAQHAAFAERERALLDLIEALTREINEKDIRFTRLWQKLHKADRLYNWHINRADFYEELATKRQDALDKLLLLGPLRTRLRRKLARTALGRFLVKVLRAIKGKRP